MSKYVNIDDVLEHAQVNCEDAGFIMKLTDYLLDEAEEVVTCGRCRHCHVKERLFKGQKTTYCICSENSRYVEAEDYCAWGERA